MGLVQTGFDGNDVPKNIQVQIQDDGGNTVHTIKLQYCVPLKWNNIKDENGMFDEIELSVGRIDLD